MTSVNFLDFRTFYELFIKPYCKKRQVDIINIIFTGSPNGAAYDTQHFQYFDKSQASNIVNGKYKFAHGYIKNTYTTYPLQQRADFLRQLDLTTLPQDDLYFIPRKLDDYLVPQKIMQTIYGETDFSKQLAHLLLFIINYVNQNYAEVPHSAEPADYSLLKPIYQSSFYRKIGDSICRYLIAPDNSSTLSSNDTWGWNRLLDKFGAGDWSTADGLCIAVYTNCKNTYYLDNRDNIIESLWKKRGTVALTNTKDSLKGFKSDNQMYPSLSATALVAKAFLMERSFTYARKTFNDLQELWQNRSNSIYTNNDNSIPLSVLCYVLDTMTLFDPYINEVKEIEKIILNRAVYNQHGEIRYWKKYGKNEKSLANTACAITALINSYKRRDEIPDLPSLYNCELMLQDDSAWSDELEIYHRKSTINGQEIHDSTQFWHCTSLECITALLTLGHHKKDSLIINHLSSILDSQQQGMWSHPINNSTYQMWMIHEVLKCIDTYKNAFD